MIDRTHLPYRQNVGIMVLNRDGKVWVGKRIKHPGTDTDRFWQMPQGGIDEGEDPKAAALRELYEETGIKSVEPLGETPEWLHYDFPEGVKRKIAERYRGQKQMWYVYRFTGQDSEIQINPPPDGHKAEFDQWRWVDMDELPDLVVEFKRDVYEQLVRLFRHLTG